MKKKYLEPQVKIYIFSPSLMDDEQISTIVFDDPINPDNPILSNSHDMWGDEYVNLIFNVWEQE